MASTIKRRRTTRPAQSPNVARSFRSKVATLKSSNSRYPSSSVVISTGRNCTLHLDHCLHDSAQILRSIPNASNSQPYRILICDRPHKQSPCCSKFLTLTTLSISLLRHPKEYSEPALRSLPARFRAQKKFFGEYPAIALWCTYRLAQT